MKPILFVLAAFLLSGCAAPDKSQLVMQEPLEEIQEGVAEVTEAGSLWKDGNTSMFSDRKAREIGDIVTVLISEQASATKEATTSTSRTSNMSASIPNFFGLENDDIWTSSHNPIDLQNLVNADFANGFDGNGTTSRKEDLNASLTTQVVGATQRSVEDSRRQGGDGQQRGADHLSYRHRPPGGYQRQQHHQLHQDPQCPYQLYRQGGHQRQTGAGLGYAHTRQCLAFLIDSDGMECRHESPIAQFFLLLLCLPDICCLIFCFAETARASRILPNCTGCVTTSCSATA
jgi:hypothetical protein